MGSVERDRSINSQDKGIRKSSLNRSDMEH